MSVAEVPVPEQLPAPRFRCIACEQVHDIAGLDHHASVGGRIGEGCVRTYGKQAVALIDTFGVNGKQALALVRTYGIGAKAHCDRLVVKLGGTPRYSGGRNIPWLLELRHTAAAAEMQPERQATQARVSRRNFGLVSGAALTKDQYTAMSDAEKRTLLAREYGSIAR